MKLTLRWRVTPGLAGFLLVLLAALMPATVASAQGVTQPMATTPFQGTVINYANVRSGTTTHDHILSVSSPGSTVTVYDQVVGQSLWAGNLWDRISSPSDSPRFIYSALVQTASTGGNGGTPPSANAAGKLIKVVISKQWLWAYDNGTVVFDTPVTTAQPGLITPTGTFQIFSHLHPTTFYSPWPPGSPYWYPPTHINYAMGWHSGGYFIHDSYWRSVYGPGTNVWHYDPVDGYETGTHGCITGPLQAIIWLYNWAPNGTTVEVDP